MFGIFYSFLQFNIFRKHSSSSCHKTILKQFIVKLGIEKTLILKGHKPNLMQREFIFIKYKCTEAYTYKYKCTEAYTYKEGDTIGLSR